jgi:hypothetical protein
VANGSEDEWWSETATVVRRLVRRGMSQSDAEDAVQDAVAKAISRGVAFTSRDHLRRWVTVAAWRRGVDVYRRETRITPAEIAYVPAGYSQDDPAIIAEQRDAVRLVLDGLQSLNDTDRAALFDDSAHHDRRDAVRVNVRRHRARKRLLAMVDGALGVFAWLRLRSTLSRAAPVALAAFTVVSISDHLGAPRDQQAGSAQVEVYSTATGDGTSTTVLQASGERRSPTTGSPTQPTPPATFTATTRKPARPGLLVVTVATPTGEPASGGLREGSEEPLLCVRTFSEPQCPDVTGQIPTAMVPLPTLPPPPNP